MNGRGLVLVFTSGGFFAVGRNQPLGGTLAVSFISEHTPSLVCLPAVFSALDSLRSVLIVLEIALMHLVLRSLQVEGLSPCSPC